MAEGLIQLSDLNQQSDLYICGLCFTRLTLDKLSEHLLLHDSHTYFNLNETSKMVEPIDKSVTESLTFEVINDREHIDNETGLRTSGNNVSKLKYVLLPSESQGNDYEMLDLSNNQPKTKAANLSGNTTEKYVSLLNSGYSPIVHSSSNVKEKKSNIARTLAKSKPFSLTTSKPKTPIKGSEQSTTEFKHTSIFPGNREESPVSLYPLDNLGAQIDGEKMENFKPGDTIMQLKIPCVQNGQVISVCDCSVVFNSFLPVNGEHMGIVETEFYMSDKNNAFTKVHEKSGTPESDANLFMPEKTFDDETKFLLKERKRGKPVDEYKQKTKKSRQAHRWRDSHVSQSLQREMKKVVMPELLKDNAVAKYLELMSACAEAETMSACAEAETMSVCAEAETENADIIKPELVLSEKPVLIKPVNADLEEVDQSKIGAHINNSSTADDLSEINDVYCDDESNSNTACNDENDIHDDFMVKDQSFCASTSEINTEDQDQDQINNGQNTKTNQQPDAETSHENVSCLDMKCEINNDVTLRMKTSEIENNAKYEPKNSILDESDPEILDGENAKTLTEFRSQLRQFVNEVATEMREKLRTELHTMPSKELEQVQKVLEQNCVEKEDQTEKVNCSTDVISSFKSEHTENDISTEMPGEVDKLQNNRKPGIITHVIFCSICNKKLPQDTDIKVHVENHRVNNEIRSSNNSTIPYTTNSCEPQVKPDGTKDYPDEHEIYSSDSKFEHHMNSDVKAKKLKKKHSITYRMKSPKNIATGRKNKSIFKTVTRSNLTAKSYLCAECGMGFSYQSALYRHNKLHTDTRVPDIIKMDGTEDGIMNTTYNCPYCNLEFMGKADMNNHRLNCKKRPLEKCHLCDFQSKGSLALTRHLVAVHNEKPFKCEYCPKTFKLKGSLRDHVKFKHELDFLYCEICGKHFYKQNNYLHHKEIQHSGFRFQCNFCGSLFKDKKCWKLHENSHKGMYDYACVLCKLNFYKPKHYVLHMKNVHEIERTVALDLNKTAKQLREKLCEHVCSICNEVFALESAYLRHMEHQHHVFMDSVQEQPSFDDTQLSGIVTHVPAEITQHEVTPAIKQQEVTDIAQQQIALNMVEQQVPEEIMHLFLTENIKKEGDNRVDDHQN